MKSKNCFSETVEAAMEPQVTERTVRTPGATA
jgi:hypothetical protein